MLKLSRSLFHRRSVALVLTFAAVAAAAAFLVPQTTDAQQGRCGLEFIYYSDASHTDVVGYRAYEPPECGCTLYSWGTISVHKEIFDFFC